MNGLYDHPDAPAVRYYDLYTPNQNVDLDFWIAEARRAAGPVLELACGTGRVLIPLARAGVSITGMDLSPGMLETARRKLAAEPDDVRERVTLVEGDMSDFSLEGRFNLIFIAFNAFYVLDDEAQWAALATIRRHLSPGGWLILDIFDPSVTVIANYLGTGTGHVRLRHSFTDPASGHQIMHWEARRYDVAGQIAETEFVFEELDEQGHSLTRTVQQFRLRYRYRYEMEYLLRLSGYQLDALYGGYEGGPFRPGELHNVWVARPA